MKPTAALLASSALFVIVPLTVGQNSENGHLERASIISQNGGVPSRSPESSKAPVQDSHQRDEAKGRHTIRVIDASSKAPVVKANVTVELKNTSSNAKRAARWQGRTDAKGSFAFICEMPNGSTKTHISIEAAGYWTLDDEFLLAEDRVFRLQKSD
jgi:hypothetical protein